MYGYRREVALPFQSAVEKTRAKLQEEGFGVLTEIDVKETLKKKLDVEFDNYIIMGACNPPFAYRALQAERDIGLVMPCNVIVYEAEGRTYVAATLPTVTMGVVDNPELAGLAEQVQKKLTDAVDRV